MDKNKDYLEEIIRRELNNEAETIEAEVDFSDDSEGVPGEAKDRIRASLKAQIAAYERERSYAKLSEEDLEALRVGKEELKRRADAEEKKVVVRKKRRIRRMVALAAVLLLVFVLGANAFGSRERVAEFMRLAIGDREITRVDSSDENKVVGEEKEDEAYELVAKELGVEPVRVVTCLEEMTFSEMTFDKNLQLAEMTYLYNDEKIVFVISASYGDTSWGFEVEDKITNEYMKDIGKSLIEVIECETPRTSTKRYFAKFKYQGIEYYLIATMNQAEFDKVLDNLNFVS